MGRTSDVVCLPVGIRRALIRYAVFIITINIIITTTPLAQSLACFRTHSSAPQQYIHVAALYVTFFIAWRVLAEFRLSC